MTAAPFLIHYLSEEEKKKKRKRISQLSDQIVIETDMTEEEIKNKLREVLEDENIKIDDKGSVFSSKESVWDLVAIVFFFAGILFTVFSILSFLDVVEIGMNLYKISPFNLFLISIVCFCAFAFLFEPIEYYDFIEIDTRNGKNYVIIRRFDSDWERLVDELTIKELVDAFGGKIMNVGV